MNYDRVSSLNAELAPLPCAVGSLSPARQLLGGVTRRPTDQRDAMPAFAGYVDHLAKLHHPRASSQPLDDVRCDIANRYKLAWVSPQPWPTQAGFTPPTPGSPASLFRFKVVKLAHRSKSSSSVRRGSETTAGAIAEWQKGLTA